MREITAADSIVQRLRAGYAAFNDGNVSEMLEELDPEVEMVLSMGGPEGTLTFRGHEGIADWATALGDAWRDVTFEPLEIECDTAGRRALAVVRVRTRGRTSDMGLERMEAHVVVLGPTGKVTRLQGFTDLDEARAAFEASEPGL
jgi:ketosteroid isomerase-like protein